MRLSTKPLYTFPLIPLFFKIEYKKIPIPTQAEDLINWNKPLTADLHRLKIKDITTMPQKCAPNGCFLPIFSRF